MIKCENGNVQIKGTRMELLYELSCIFRSLIEDGVTDNETILGVLAFSEMTPDEIHELNGLVKKAMIDAIDDMDNIGDALNMLGALHEMLGKE